MRHGPWLVICLAVTLWILPIDVNAASIPAKLTIQTYAAMTLNDGVLDLKMIRVGDTWEIVHSVAASQRKPPPRITITSNGPVWLDIESTGFETSTFKSFENPLNDAIKYLIKYPVTRASNAYVEQSIAPKGKGYISKIPYGDPKGFTFTWDLDWESTTIPEDWYRVPVGLNTDTITLTISTVEPGVNAGTEIPLY